MSRPLVSIVVPTCNRADSLRRRLAEIRRLAYEPLEILISDNASADHTEAVGREAAAADPRVRYVRHATTIGLYGNHNFCLDQARGELLCVFHDHDEHDPMILEAYVDFLTAHPRVGVVCSDWELIDEQGRPIGLRVYPVAEVTPGLSYIEQTMRSGQSSIGIPGAMIRRRALGDIRIDEQGRLGFGDFVMWFKLAERWDVGHVRRRLWRWRQERQMQSARTITSMAQDYEDNCLAYCDDHLRRWPQHVELMLRWRRLVRRYLFWALAYELGLALRGADAEPDGRSGSRTLFEMLGYHLNHVELRQTMELLARYRTGADQAAALMVIRALMRLNVTWPLAAATRYHPVLRTLLGLK